MVPQCAQHPEVAATGVCVACDRPLCRPCLRTIGGTLQCATDCPAEPSAVIQDPPHDRSDILLPSWLDEDPEDKSKTSILDMSPVVPLVVPIQETAEAEPEAPGEAPMPIVIPGTRRASIQTNCALHLDTPAVVLCAACQTPICSLCIEETPRGLVCSPTCARALMGVTAPAGTRTGLMIGVGVFALAVAFVIIAIVRGPSPAEKPAPVVAKVEPTVEPKPEPKVEPKIEVPKPEPPKPEPPRPEPPKPEPPKPEPPKPKPEPPKPEPPKPEPPKAEPPKPEPPKPKPEPPKPEPPKPEPPKVVVVRVEPPPPPPLTPLEQSAKLIREATPLLGEVAGSVDDAVLRRIDRGAVLERINTVKKNLEQARAIYATSRDSAPDPALLDRRVERIDRVLDSVPAARDRVLVAESIETAARKIRESAALGRDVADGVDSPPGEEIEQSALRVKKVLLREKLREARALYASVRDRAPDPALIDTRMKKLDGILGSLQ